MTWYAVYDVASGNLTSTGTVIGDPTAFAARGLAVVTLATNPAGLDWDPVAHAFAAPAVDGGTSAVLNSYPTWEWVMRFTPDEIFAIHTSQDHAVQALFFELTLSQTVQPAGPIITGGLQVLAAKSVITPDRIPALSAN